MHPVVKKCIHEGARFAKNNLDRYLWSPALEMCSVRFMREEGSATRILLGVC